MRSSTQSPERPAVRRLCSLFKFPNFIHGAFPALEILLNSDAHWKISLAYGQIFISCNVANARNNVCGLY
jgi:hypothetical protein